VASQRRLAAILFTDLVGFTASAQSDEREALDRLREQEKLVRPLFQEHEGREVKSTGDGALVEFASALKATECAFALQKALHERNAKTAAAPLLMRIGIHLGDVEGRGADIFGDAVNVASRVVAASEPEGICLTQQVYDQVHGKLRVPIEPLGTQELKGVKTPLALYRIALPWARSALAPEAGPVPRVAVLPLLSLSPDRGDEYFADGLTEELISILSRVRELRVIARTSVARFKAASTPVQEVGRELGVTAVLEGSVRKAGDRLRITLQLVDVKTQEPLWSERFDRVLEDVFEIQSEVAERTARALKLRLLGEERSDARERPTESMEAYGAYLRGLHAVHDGGEDAGEVAQRFFEEAIRADPSFASAYAQLANTIVGSLGETRPARATIPRVRELVSKALELNPRSSDAHVAYANLLMQADLDWTHAESELQTALVLNPSSTLAHQWYALLLRALQRFDEARRELETALRLDPSSRGVKALLASVLRLSGDVSRANEFVRAAFVTEEELQGREVTRAYSCFMGGDREGARALALTVTEPVGASIRLDWAVLMALLGDPHQADHLLQELEVARTSRYVSNLQFAALHSALGHAEQALALLEEDLKEGDRGLWFVYQGVAWDPIRTDPRFTQMLSDMRLPTRLPRRFEVPRRT